RLDLSVLIRNIDASNPGREHMIYMFLEKARLPTALRAPHQRQRPGFDMRQHVWRNRPVIISKLLLRELRLLIENLPSMSQPHWSTPSGRLRWRLHLVTSNLGRHSSSRRMRRSTLTSPSWSNFGLLPANLRRRLVFAKPLERRLTHQIVRGPRRKVHFSH